MKKIISYFLIFAVIFSLTGCGDRELKTTSNSKKRDDNTSTNSEQVRDITDSEKMLIGISTLIDAGLAFDAGNYIKGDIPAGEYAFIKFEGSGSYYEEEDAAGNIIDNENFDSFGYVYVHEAGNITTRGVLISTFAFQVLDVSGAKEIYEKLNNQTSYNQSGYYKVGYDIDPGSYILESMGRGYYAIMSGPVSNSEIIDNENFNGRVSINIMNGQYLNVSRSLITN